MRKYTLCHALSMRRYLSISLPGILVLCLIFCSGQKQVLFASTHPHTHAPDSTISTSPINQTWNKQASLQLQTLQYWIMLMHQYGGNTAIYQSRYTTDQQALQQATTDATYQTALHRTVNDIDTIKIPALQTEISNIRTQLGQQASKWEQQHPYYDAYNQTTYSMGFEYDDHTGIDAQIQDNFAEAKTVADYQQIIDNLNVYLTNFHAMQQNASDNTPYDQAHASDLQLMKTYNRLDQKVLVVSLAEQAMRVYDHGKLIRSFLVTTGQPAKPSLPGNWWIESHEKNVIFKANVPQSSPYWFPDTPINFAMQYHSNGYYIHDSWWRVEYGPHTQFPHQDVTGDTAADLGSHGCINMSRSDANWVYNYVGVFTGVIVY